MKRRILWIFAITLLSGCGLLHRKEAVQTPEAKQSPEVSAEVQEAARIYELMHSDELNALSEKIVASPSTDTYLERGDALLTLAETENLYERPEAKPAAAASGKKRRKKKMSGSRKKKTASGGKNLGRNMNERRPFSEGAAGSAELERRNAQAGIYAAAQRGGRNRARQG